MPAMDEDTDKRSKDERRSAFERWAAKLRKATSGRKHTPAEMLQREGRNER